MIFFGLISLLFLIVSIIFGIPVFHDYFKTGLVERFPTLIFSGFMLMVSLIMFTCGIILEVVAKKHRQLFELFLVIQKRIKINLILLKCFNIIFNFIYKLFIYFCFSN